MSINSYGCSWSVRSVAGGLGSKRSSHDIFIYYFQGICIVVWMSIYSARDDIR